MALEGTIKDFGLPDIFQLIGLQRKTGHLTLKNEKEQLTVTYLTDAHRACAQRLAHWMREDCGFDSVEIDAVGNVVGVYRGADADAQRLLTGSHYDTVRNGGKYDGRLGIFVPMACRSRCSAKTAARETTAVENSG